MMSSDSGFFATPFFGPYCSSKFALEGYSDSLRRELLLYGVKVIIIQPGRITTPIWDKGEDFLEEIKHEDSMFKKEAMNLDATAKHLIVDSLQPMTECFTVEIEASGKILTELNIEKPSESKGIPLLSIAGVCDALSWGLDDVISWNEAIQIGQTGLEAFHKSLDNLAEWISSAWENWGTFSFGKLGNTDGS